MSGKSCSSVTSVLNEVDTMMSGSCSQDQPKAGTIMTEVLQPVSETTSIDRLFSTYMITPSYRAETADLLLVKLVTAKGEPFYLLDHDKALRPVVCGLTEVFLAPYDADSACVDECEGLPALHIVPECIAKQLFSQALKKVCTARQFVGIVFVSSVGLQFYYRGKDCSPGDIPMISSVYRVAADAEGHIEAREVKGVVTCDYPVPYLLVDQEVFTEGSHSTAIVESLTQANAQLVDTLCRIQYVTLHEAEEYPDDLDEFLGKFMSNHSHRVKGLLDMQLSGAGSMSGKTACDDAFVRRQRKTEIDLLVRLMMREVELIGELKRTLEELAYVKKTVEQCPPPLKIEVCPSQNTGSGPTAPRLPCEDPEDEITDPLLRPLMKINKEDLDRRSKRIVPDDDIASVEDMMTKPMSEDCDGSEQEFADADALSSPSSASQCSR